MRAEVDNVDARIAAIAARQHGVIARRQLIAAGLSGTALSRRVSLGRLHRVHRGVYAVGHVGLSIEGRWLAAVMACGSGAALSHGSAAALWNLLRPMAGPVDVSVPSQGGRACRRGLRVHRTPTLAAAPRLVIVRRGIPVTSVARTISDLRTCLPPRLVRRAIRQAEILRLLPDEFGIESDGTRSDLEGDFLNLCRRHRLPPPEVNVSIGRWTVDFLWRWERIAVETDSYAYHRGRIAFQDDHARDLYLRQRGIDVIRISERQLTDEPAMVAAVLKRALARAS